MQVLSALATAQADVLLNFFVGAYDADMNYVDRFSWVFTRYTTSVMGFWFDSATSIPWSCFDLQSYLVRSSAVVVISYSVQPWPLRICEQLKRRDVCVAAAMCGVCGLQRGYD